MKWIAAIFASILFWGCFLETEEEVILTIGYSGEYGTLVDHRDGNVYKTVTIGNQEWMAENLRYETSPSRPVYAWDDAVKACPEGWHLPAFREWRKLLDDVSSYKDVSAALFEENSLDGFISTNESGFSATAVVYINDYGTEIDYPRHAVYWSTDDEYNNRGAYVIIGMNDVDFEKTMSSSKARYPIRCLKGEGHELRSSSSSVPSSSSRLSSSSAKSSSSSGPTFADSVTYDVFKDVRDGKTYHTIEMDGSVWMMELLRYETDSVKTIDNSPMSDTSHLYYTWTEAMFACPEGWRLPDTTEWRAFSEGLIKMRWALGSDFDEWLDDTGLFGEAHYHDVYGGSHAWGANTDVMWTSEDEKCQKGYKVNLATNNHSFFLSNTNKGNSVRCIKGEYSDEVLSRCFETKISSSSSVYVDPADVKQGEFTDERDGRTYKFVTIGSQTWMAENLNFAVDSSFCYEDEPGNCAKYGRLYPWSAAMDSVGVFSDGAKGCGYGIRCDQLGVVRGVCPEGWHVPSVKDAKVLLMAVDKTIYDESKAEYSKGNELKSALDWDGELDAYHFTALPAGVRYHTGQYTAKGQYGWLWLTTAASNNHLTENAVIFAIGDHYGALQYSANKAYALPVRCLKD